MREKKICVLHHGPSCPDGFAAAYAAWNTLGDTADYIPINYGDPMPDLAGYETIYIVDFSFPRDTMIELMYDFNVICLDHHKTAQAALSELEVPEGSKILFDMSKSGAVLTWEHFNPNSAVPQLFLYIQDRDLWHWKLHRSKEVSAAISIVPREFPAWHYLQGVLDQPEELEKFSSQGWAILKYQEQLVTNLAEKATLTWIGGFHVPTVNSAVLQSEIGNALCIKHENAPFAAVFYVKEDQEIYSLRSMDGRQDVSEICKAFGGGGHKNAAGFSVAKVRSPIV